MGTEMKIERKSSIDKEPQTLFFDQIQYAREAALYVLSTKTMEEALRIFTEGLQPVIIAEGKINFDDKDLSDFIDEHNNFLLLERFRDIDSAPF
ncbi:uncharacterized protein LOC110110078 [Dendrobium catenatum]|uniref:Uncharacterized protein n=1 Tax=Dendrobium catenatum TaxID=906689 RepID=A0A2I0VTI0_9ASPA|nr:uncharacterized protein LOC110110078 [Dendrobium catenatum]XP_028555849.1 uncharacterized protein LOC110110078 [Dendrobium catenatum]PKU66689.1 hypothetical protein MA16_Dca022509 [Dendrobium catenatum]